MQFHPSGTRIAGRYEVAGRPLMGGMGVVCFCHDRQEDRAVALKTFKPEYLPNRAARGRFLQEGETWVRLGKHPHVVRCYQVFVDEPRPEVYLVLELVAKEEGRQDASLRSWLAPGRPLPMEQALLIALQIARGMAHASAVIPGFVHRDLKPENVLVGADRLSNADINRVRVTDFGLVRGLPGSLLGQATETPAAEEKPAKPGHLTQMGVLLGTAEYMAPEQWEGPNVAVQADIYAFGCILGEMVTGRMLVRGEPRRELGRAHRGGAALAAVRDAPALLCELLSRCLAVEPAGRYADWTAVEAALAPAYRATAGRPPPEPEGAASLSRTERVVAGWSYLAIGISHLQMGQAAQAFVHLATAAETGRAEQECQLEAACLHGLGSAYRNVGDTRRALDYFEQVLEIERELGDRCGEGRALDALGVAHADLGDPQRAVGYHEQALAIIRGASDLLSEGSILGNLGVACRRAGDTRRAIQCNEQSLAICREIGDRRGEGIALVNLAGDYRQLGDIRRAIYYTERALAIHREIGDRRAEAAELGNLGVAHTDLGDDRRAIDYLNQALVISREIGDRRLEGTVLGSLGLACASLGEIRQAIAYHEQALLMMQEAGDGVTVGIALSNLAMAYLQLGDARQASNCAQRALAIHRAVGDRRAEGADLGNLGVAHAGLGDSPRAIGYLEQALAIERENGYLDELAKTCLNLAQLYDQQGIPAQALPLAREAAYLASQMGQAARAQQAQQLVAELERQGR
jgi:tetratricopeptide (TPR) repeat protein